VTVTTFWTLKKQWTVAFIVLLLFVSTLPLAAAATPKSSCPTKGKIVRVVYLESVPKSAAVGTTVATNVGVVYVGETAVALSPQTISFRWVSAAGEKLIENAPVVPIAGSKGGYMYEQKVGDDFPTGKVTIFVVACSCSDAEGNSGPTADTSSDSTEEDGDNSVVEIGATAATPSGGIPGFPMESILIGLIAASAILVLLRRRHASDKAPSVRAPEG
jgi:hypothetical protein